MNDNREHLDSDRLAQAADAALAAASDVAGYTNGPAPFPADLMGSPLQPNVLADFTKWEIEQACEFLVRLGMLAPRSAQNNA